MNFNFFIMKNIENKPDPTVIKKWISVIIAILSAIAGALTESATSFISNLI